MSVDHDQGKDQDRQLVEAWRNGDTRAGDQLLQRHFRTLRGVFLNKVSTPHDAEDLIQKTLEGCARSIETFRADSSFRTFLFRIAHNKLNDYIRAKDRRPGEVNIDEISIADVDPSPSSIVARRRELQLIVQALRHIPLKYQIVFEHYYWQGLSAREIGEILDLGEPAVRGRIRTAKELVRKEVERLAQSKEELRSTLDNLERWAAEIREQLDDAKRTDDDAA